MSLVQGGLQNETGVAAQNVPEVGSYVSPSGIIFSQQLCHKANVNGIHVSDQDFPKY